MATHRTRGPLRAVVGGLTALLVIGCGTATPAPTSTIEVTPTPSAAAAADTLRIGVAAGPTGFIVPTGDEATQLVQRLLQAALYRLDARLVPQPDLAAAAPTVSANGLTWQVTLASGRQFSDGSQVSAADVVRTYQLALSGDCPFGDLCAPIGRAVAAVKAVGQQKVTFTLRHPWAPLEADVLAQLPILPAAGLAASVARLVAGASSVTPAQVTELLGTIQATTSSATCGGTPSPASCDPAFYTASLLSLLGQAGVTSPSAAAFRGADGSPDPSAYAAALLGQLEALAAVQAASGTDQAAAALPILDLQARPVGAGPFELTQDVPGHSIELTRWGASPARGAPAHVRLEVFSDPTVAATALQSGDLDWLPETTADLLPGLATSSHLTAATRPSDTLRLIVFNVRAGHPYADPTARAAFAACLDPAALAADAASQHDFVAVDPLAPGSWAAQGHLPWPSGAAAAQARLEAAGWQRGSDGVYARLGLRLASSIAVRPGQTDLLALLTAASTRLRACGIALDVQATTLSGEDLLATLEYPNAFDVYLASEPAGLDPDDALGRLAGDRATTILDPGDANFGGWQDAATDQLLAAGRRVADPAARSATYTQLEIRLAQLVAILPIAWDPAEAAIARRVTLAGRAVDPATPGYDRELLSWRLTGP
ncbi:MAG: ABC transporter substrate-binding protein [Candidatus Limnocylindrales bacterium]